MVRKIVYFVLVILTISFFGYPSPVSAQSGMIAPRCDDVLNPESFFEKYINTAEFKAIHPTYNQWQRLPDDYKDKAVCINENEKALLMWNFILPASLSKYQINYKYQAVLIVNWDRSAKIAHEITPEELILKVESLPEASEFITKFTKELAQSTVWFNYFIGPSEYGESSGYVSPLKIDYATNNLDSITLSEKGVNGADLNINQDWVNFPTVQIGLNLAKEALKSTNCNLNISPDAVSRYSPRAQRKEQSEEFMSNSYNISCSDNKYHYTSVDIYPNDGRYEVWLENVSQISSGKISDSELKKIQAIGNQNSKTTSSPNPSPIPTIAKYSTVLEKQNLDNTKPFLILVGFLVLFVAVLVFLLIRNLRKIKTDVPEAKENETIPFPIVNQTPVELPPVEGNPK